MSKINCNICTCNKCENKTCEYFCNKRSEDCDLGINNKCDNFKSIVSVLAKKIEKERLESEK